MKNLVSIFANTVIEEKLEFDYKGTEYIVYYTYDTYDGEIKIKDYYVNNDLFEPEELSDVEGLEDFTFDVIRDELAY